MWIRSQDDGKLIKIRKLIVSCQSSVQYGIYTHDMNEMVNLGCYSTRIRAEETLDEIQNCIARGCKAYTMPKE